MVVWKHEAYNTDCKARIDKLIPQFSLITDVKTTDGSINPDDWLKRGLNAGFEPHWQAYWYLQAGNSTGDTYKDFLWILFEKKPPFKISIVRCPDQLIKLAGKQIDPCIKEYINCKKTGNFPGYPDEIVTPEVPGWYLNKHKYLLEEGYE